MERDAIQRGTQCNRAPARGKERGGKPFFVFFAKNSAPECSMAFFKSTKSGSYSSLTKKARPLKTAYIGSGLKKLRGCATVTILSLILIKTVNFKY
ncbi:hypothetical protein LS48_07355 [Aequorivita aquimaris]|uniref:Uncharacterized protein n=1 Tax=Aequorivita aquimaris TaxID=1548749 RepID=A0A137RHE3_9FLAO|nr:hypothetical protein [Aequorivita aquimaris]KXN98910.1 hypothetical protein LS48_07355 [Aequorivita aquimaris]